MKLDYNAYPAYYDALFLYFRSLQLLLAVHMKDLQQGTNVLAVTSGAVTSHRRRKVLNIGGEGGGQGSDYWGRGQGG